MRLMSPSPGEVVDRLTILKLKIEAAEKQNRQDMVETFKLEKESLQLYYGDRRFSLEVSLTNRLEEINSQLWGLEDEQRKLLKEIEAEEDEHGGYIMEANPSATFTQNAITIVKLNDKRAETVQEINKVCNISQPEKIYSNEAH